MPAPTKATPAAVASKERPAAEHTGRSRPQRKTRPGSRKWAFRLWLLGVWLVAGCLLALVGVLALGLANSPSEDGLREELHQWHDRQEEQLRRWRDSQEEQLRQWRDSPKSAKSAPASDNLDLTPLEKRRNELTTKISELEQNETTVTKTIQMLTSEAERLRGKIEGQREVEKELKPLLNQAERAREALQTIIDRLGKPPPQTSVVTPPPVTAPPVEPPPTDCVVVAMSSSTPVIDCYWKAFRDVLLDPKLRELPKYRIGFLLVTGAEPVPICPLTGSTLEKDTQKFKSAQSPPSTATSQLSGLAPKVRGQFPDLGKKKCHCIIVAAVDCLPEQQTPIGKWTNRIEKGDTAENDLLIDVILLGTKQHIETYLKARLKWDMFTADCGGLMQVVEIPDYDAPDPKALQKLTATLQRLTLPPYPKLTVSATKDKKG